jgi:N-acetylglucosamine malate deacetylase 1
MKKKKILVVAAHPDDEVLGCGGTMAKFANQGHEVRILLLGSGRADPSSPQERQKILRQSDSANFTLLGFRERVAMYQFPDNAFDSVKLLDIVHVIEKQKELFQPDSIFTHSIHDLNIDHRITYQAVITATRPMKGECVRDIFSFEVLSSTEWNYPTRFSPNFFMDISETINTKLQAIQCYKGELKKFPHPRSLKGIRLNSEYWGMKVGYENAEAFELIRAF